MGTTWVLKKYCGEIQTYDIEFYFKLTLGPNTSVLLGDRSKPALWVLDLTGEYANSNSGGGRIVVDVGCYFIAIDWNCLSLWRKWTLLYIPPKKCFDRIGYASGATVQIILFSVIAIELKRRAPAAHTFPEVIRARYPGKTAHIIYLVFGIMTNILVTAMLLTGRKSYLE
jgi:hypothetical protein